MRDVSPNTLVQTGGIVSVATADLWVVLDVPEELLHQLEAKGELAINGLWQLLPQEVAKVALAAKSLD